MNDVIYELSGRLTHPDPTVSRPSPYPMFVLTNETNLFGATCLLYKDLLKHFSDCYGELSDMVREVNDSQLMDDEILSTHAYYYSRRKNEITM